ncbi:MAG: PAS domain S-box protein, partial [Desulfobulbaceae bacterium]|nr:PAS domain S-box protein [Desulfobulbaceae bacterium]
MKDKAIRLLFIEDDKVDQMAFERFVKRENLPYDYTIAGSVTASTEILKSTSFDVIISDYMLGDGTSFELFELFKNTPVIITTGSGDEDVAVDAMKLGASDYLIKDPEGNYLKVLPATVELALKRKQNEDELQKYHEHLESMVVERTIELRAEIVEQRSLSQIIEKSLNEIFIFDADSYKFLFVNHGARINTGYSQAELLKMTPVDLKPEVDLPSFEEILAPLKKQQQKHVTFEAVHKRKDGSTYQVEIYLQKTEYRLMPVFVAIMLDVTQRKEISQRYQELVERTTNLITQVDIQGKFLYVNHMGKTLFGINPEQLIGQNALQFVHSEDRERTEAWLRDCQTKKISQGSIENRQVNQVTGDIHDLLWTTNFHYDEQGQLVSANGIAKDITEMKQLQ